MKSEKIAVIGNGDWGSAITSIVAEQYPVTVYVRNKGSSLEQSGRVSFTSKIRDTLDYEYLFIVVPSQNIRSICKELVGLGAHAKIIVCAKGIDLETGQMLSQVIERHFPRNICAVLSGPNFALDVRQKLFTCTSIASSEIEVARDLAEKFSTDYFTLVPNNDVVATQIFAALKNVLAIACGIVSALGLKDNSRAAVITQGIKEMIDFATALGGVHETIISPAGIGDIFLTCSSGRSRNTTFGEELVTKYLAYSYEEIINNQKITVEGMHTVVAMHKHHKDLIKSLPMHSFVYEVITKKYDDIEILRGLLKRALSRCFVM